MTPTRKRTIPVVLLMAGIVAVAAVVTAFTGTVGRESDRRQVVTTTYPLYVAVTNILGDTDTLAVKNLAEASVGCMHDMTLSPANRIALSQASLVVMNGGGAEAFLADVLAAMPDLPVVDTTAGIELLPACHTHDHAHDDREATDAHAFNEHAWVSPTRYAAQITAATEALCALDPTRASVYQQNGAAYRGRVLALGERLRELADKLPTKNCVIFHDSLAYLAEELGLTVAVSLHIGEENGVSAHDLAQVQTALAADKDTLLLYDNQYTLRYAMVDRLAAAGHVLALDTAVIGRGQADDWLRAMQQNIALMEAIV